MNNQKNFFARHKVITGIIIIIVLCVIGGLSQGGNKNDKLAGKNNSKKTIFQPPKEEKKYSLDKFMQVQMGMTYDQVKGILGDGTEESSVGDGDAKAVTYSWKNNDASNISIEIQGGKVVNKTQAMLQSMNSGATLDKYNQINNGITYEQVKHILGEGELVSQTDIEGAKSEMYEWINVGGANMNITFQDGKVEAKAQSGLK